MGEAVFIDGSSIGQKAVLPPIYIDHAVAYRSQIGAPSTNLQALSWPSAISIKDPGE
jgi:hypothetical protein